MTWNICSLEDRQALDPTPLQVLCWFAINFLKWCTYRPTSVAISSPGAIIFPFSWILSATLLPVPLNENQHPFLLKEIFFTELMTSWMVSEYGLDFEMTTLQLKRLPCTSKGIKLPNVGFEQVGRQKNFCVLSWVETISLPQKLGNLFALWKFARKTLQFLYSRKKCSSKT